MVGVSGRGKSGAKHSYYSCMGHKKRTCDKKAIRQDWIEGIVMQYVTELLQDEPLLKSIARETYQYYLQNQDTSYVDLLRSDLRQVEKSLKNMLHAIEMGIITDETRDRMEELSSRKKELTAAIEVAQAQPKITEDIILFFLLQFRNKDLKSPAVQRNLLDVFVNAIYLYDDRISICFNYKNNTHNFISKAGMDCLSGVCISLQPLHQA